MFNFNKQLCLRVSSKNVHFNIVFLYAALERDSATDILSTFTQSLCVLHARPSRTSTLSKYQATCLKQVTCSHSGRDLITSWVTEYPEDFPCFSSVLPGK